jgi:hypothetical protein
VLDIKEFILWLIFFIFIPLIMLGENAKRAIDKTQEQSKPKENLSEKEISK